MVTDQNAAGIAFVGGALNRAYTVKRRHSRGVTYLIVRWPERPKEIIPRERRVSEAGASRLERTERSRAICGSKEALIQSVEINNGRVEIAD